jgi:hypothetical protein
LGQFSQKNWTYWFSFEKKLLSSFLQWNALRLFSLLFVSLFRRLAINKYRDFQMLTVTHLEAITQKINNLTSILFLFRVNICLALFWDIWCILENKDHVPCWSVWGGNANTCVTIAKKEKKDRMLSKKYQQAYQCSTHLLNK